MSARGRSSTPRHSPRTSRTASPADPLEPLLRELAVTKAELAEIPKQEWNWHDCAKCVNEYDDHAHCFLLPYRFGIVRASRNRTRQKRQTGTRTKMAAVKNPFVGQWLAPAAVGSRCACGFHVEVAAANVKVEFVDFTSSLLLPQRVASAKAKPPLPPCIITLF